MMHTLKVTNTLADETRFKIYQHMLQEKESFSVQEIADKFHIHPNVARLHLTKLSEINVISSEYEKTGKGGRPGRKYKAIAEGITLSFPKRNDHELLDWILSIMSELGDEALVVGKRVCYSKGRQEIQRHLANHQLDVSTSSFDERVQMITEAASLIGYVPIINEHPNGKSIKFAVYNCPYHNEIAQHANFICDLHEAFLKGQFEYLFDVKEFVQIESMTNNCKYCTYHIDV